MIVVAPLHELDEAVARWTPSHIVSLASPGAEPAHPPDGVEIHRLVFNDIDAPRPGLTLATEANVAGLLSFAAAWPGDRPLLVHCWAGVSRSPAAAFVVACARTPPGAEADLADDLRRIAPFATPNRRLVALGDRLLGRDGAMTSAIAAIGRGAETATGQTFALPLTGRG